MNSTWKIWSVAAVIGFALALWWSLTPRVVIPEAGMFIGESRGCSSFHVYRWNMSKSMAISVGLNERAIPLVNGPQTFRIEEHPKDIQVHVLQFPRSWRAGDEVFCTDVGPTMQPMCTWKAKSGRLVVIKGQPTAMRGNVTHSITVLLTELVLEREPRSPGETGEEVELGPVEIDDVGVGGIPG